MKSKTHEEHANAREKAKEKLHSFYERGVDASIDLVENDCVMSMKHIETMAAPDNKIISLVVTWLKENHTNCMCAPFEAE